MYYCKDGSNEPNISNVTAHISALPKIFLLSLNWLVRCHSIIFLNFCTAANINTLLIITELRPWQLGLQMKCNAMTERELILPQKLNILRTLNMTQFPCSRRVPTCTSLTAVLQLFPEFNTTLQFNSSVQGRGRGLSPTLIWCVARNATIPPHVWVMLSAVSHIL